MENQLLTTIQQIELYCNKHTLNHRFVGSVSFGGLLNDKTTYDIAITKKAVKLQDHNPVTLYRDDGTVRDIDLILFCDNQKKMLDFKKFLIDLEHVAFRHKVVFPLISVENAIYEGMNIRDPMYQFVTALEVNKKKNLFLTFDDIIQQISWESIEPWKVVLEGEEKTEYTVRNPVADFYAYQFRAPGGIKPKDKEKMDYLKKLAERVIKEGREQQIDYLGDTYFTPWRQFIKALAQTTHPRITAKKVILAMYWSTIGTTFAHGKGVLRYVSIFSNQFTGGKQ